jgi:hypothetical protein
LRGSITGGILDGSLNNYQMKFSELFTTVFADIRVRYTSNLSIEEVVGRLEKNSVTENYFNPLRSLNSKQYGGGVDGSKFKLEPHKFVVGNLKPSISGSLKSAGDNTIIDVVLTSSKAFSSGIGLIFIAIVYFALTFNLTASNWILIIIPPLGLLFTFMLVNRTYYETVHECCWDLAKLLECEPMEVGS